MTLYALGPHRPTVYADTWVAPDANLVGQVVLEEGASVWFGTTIRADHEEIRVGRGSNVQENCVFHIDAGYPLSIGENCTIGHKVMLHGCTIGNNSLIGMGATVLNGAKVGENCLIGAGALITENKVIPDGSLVMGVPGKVVRELDAEAIKGLTLSALHYQENMRRFRDELRAVEG
ncbi:gamma carbonic anhydrase family protein [Roseobacter cerasinus]|uniref:Gamma carbonic anhydrase family protein n=1 Tax=Roseobacter cerasinus TaxID=2602289 RepID=A0A640VRZ7_9RHOB|nr:gamma carbonic anhydrase family protein [Roseobacter cerasinus]GFE50200.1 gamma carbonic anhydrase family protein [Roseobacter cerasinus]